VAIAPLVINWFGNGFQSIVVVTVVISLFPVITSVTVGLTSVDRGLRDLFEMNRASRWQTLLKLRMPHAVPYLVTGARTSSGLAVVGAIVGEFFAGYASDHYGLGYLVLQSSGQLRTDLLFATIISSALLGVMMFALVTWVGYQIKDGTAR
ncbi:MAG: ABC transporter permease subunit, partial [Planctomycetaceae bacterium]|nr:ABC transporter permease subunit [Planctomycetaceae bacterium]